MARRRIRRHSGGGWLGNQISWYLFKKVANNPRVKSIAAEAFQDPSGLMGFTGSGRRRGRVGRRRRGGRIH